MVYLQRVFAVALTARARCSCSSTRVGGVDWSAAGAASSRRGRRVAAILAAGRGDRVGPDLLPLQRARLGALPAEPDRRARAIFWTVFLGSGGDRAVPVGAWACCWPRAATCPTRSPASSRSSRGWLYVLYILSRGRRLDRQQRRRRTTRRGCACSRSACRCARYQATALDARRLDGDRPLHPVRAATSRPCCTTSSRCWWSGSRRSAAVWITDGAHAPLALRRRSDDPRRRPRRARTGAGTGSTRAGWVALVAGVAVCLLTINAPSFQGPVSDALARRRPHLDRSGRWSARGLLGAHVGTRRQSRRSSRARATGDRARVGVELAVDPAHVGLDRVARDEELVADLGDRELAAEQPQHRHLARRELLDLRRAPLRRRPRSRRSTSLSRCGEHPRARRPASAGARRAAWPPRRRPRPPWPGRARAPQARRSAPAARRRGGPGRPRARAARAPARARRRRRASWPATARGQRAHPVLLERLLRAQRVGGRDPAAARRRDRRRRSVTAASVPCARSTAMLLAPDARDRHGLLEQRRRPPRTARRGSGARRRASPARPRARASRRGVSSSTACAPSSSAALRSPLAIGQRRAQHRDARGRRWRRRRGSGAAVVGGGGRVGPALGGDLLAGVERQPRAGQAQPRVAGDDVGRERVEPAHDRGAAAALQRARSTTSAIRSAASASRPAASRWRDRGRDVAGRRATTRRRARAARRCARPSTCPRARGAARRGRRGGSETTRRARRAGRGTGWRARSRSAAAWTRRSPRTASHSGAQKRSSTQVSTRKRAPAGPAPRATSSPR